MAQSVKSLILDFGSGLDPRVVGSSPMSGSMLNTDPAWHPLSSLSAPPPILSLSLSADSSREQVVFLPLHVSRYPRAQVPGEGIALTAWNSGDAEGRQPCAWRW